MMGAATLLNVTLTLARVVGTVLLEVGAKDVPRVGVAGPILVPKIVMISPGDTEPVWKLAALSIVPTMGVPAGLTFSVTFTICMAPEPDETWTSPV